MADVATPPAAEASQDKTQVVKPEKPDDDKYKEDLAKAEKEHTAAQDKLVCCRQFPHLCVAQVLEARGPSRRELASRMHQCPVQHLLT
jgi:hypothetical protein